MPPPLRGSDPDPPRADHDFLETWTVDSLFTNNAEPDHWAQAADDDDRISNGLMEPDQARLTLGLPPKATRDQTMAAYRDLTLRYHPDRVRRLSKGAQEHAADRMTQLNRAIETLRRISNPVGP